ncbi:oligosaccharide flippase family protein [Shewanella sp. ENK2]|uniref:oligosaccharide flippase family protein n=1 Tax=Shewanella sp. ENK2 TaxID=2775245 RepID=UPI003748BB8D
MLNRKNLKNVIANLAGRFWSIAANLIVVPVYLNFLGLESYGLIALYTSIILAINVADAGLSPSFARDIARADKASDMGNALKTLEIIYLALFIIISAIVLSCSNEISKLLISSSSYSSSQNEIMIIMMVIAASAQLCTVVYRAGYMGLEKYVRVNTYTVGFSITRLFGPVVIFMWSTDLYYYFFYQLIISLMYLLFIRNRYWMEIGNPRCFKFDFVYLAGIKKFAGGLFIVSIMSVITTQLDKFMLSNMLGVKSLSIYSIASGVSMLLYSICLPIVITFYPKLTKLVKNEAFDELSDLYLKVNYFVSVVSISALLTLCYYAYDIILLWTNDAYIAESSSILIPILCTGTFFCVFSFFLII